LRLMLCRLVTERLSAERSYRANVLIVIRAVGCKAAVETKAWFPDNPGNEFTAGKPASAVVGVRNDGAAAFNISATMGTLALVSNPSGSIYNFTGMVSLDQPSNICINVSSSESFDYII